MNEDHRFSKHDDATLQVLQSLLPPKRCGLDGRVPVNEVRLPCGHVYCDLCAQDIAATAALVEQIAACKVCGTHFQLPANGAQSSTSDGSGFGLPTLDEVRTRNGLPAGNTDAFADPPVILPGSLGEKTKNALIMGNKETLPWMPPSRTVEQLKHEYTKSEQQYSDHDLFGFNSVLTPSPRFADGRLSVSVPLPMNAQDVANEFSMLRYGQPRQREAFHQIWRQATWQPEVETGIHFNDGLEDFYFNEYFDFDAYGNAMTQFMNEPATTWGHGQNQQPIGTAFASAQNDANTYTTSPQAPTPSVPPDIPSAPLTTASQPNRTPLPDKPVLTQQQPAIDPQVFDFHTGLTRHPSPTLMPQTAAPPPSTVLEPQPHRPAQLLSQAFRSPSPISPQPPTPGHSYAQFRDMSVLAGERFCFKGDLQTQAAMEEAVKANGGNVTGGGFKHTTYGIIGPGWKPGPAWARNGIKVISEEEFWELLERRQRETAAEKVGS